MQPIYNDLAYSQLPKLFSWSNGDVLYHPTVTKTTVVCYFEKHYNEGINSSDGTTEASLFFFKPDGVNSVVKLFDRIFDALASKEGFLSYQNSISAGTKGTFLAFTVKDGKFYCQSKAVTMAAPASGKNYTPISFQLQEVTEAELLKSIMALNQ